ncbi:MAG: hypothetical protein CSA62_11650 [Planctomycetota bacterium]|nr:MAG: hypothetical protein CSA62_11650 [Planctomycetota bacterium]
MLSSQLAAVLLGFFALSSAALQEQAQSSRLSFKLGDDQIRIPAPTSFLLAPPEMEAFVKAVENGLPATHRQLALFLYSGDIEKLRKGQKPSAETLFSVQSLRSMENKRISRQHFAEIRSGIRQQVGILDKALLEEAQAKESEASQRITSIHTLPPHLDESDAISIAQLFSFELESGGQKAKLVNAEILTVCNVGGVVLHLKHCCPESELELGKRRSIAWTKAILAANPKPPEQSSGLGLSLMTRIIGFCLIAALLAGAGIFLFHRRS